MTNEEKTASLLTLAQQRNKCVLDLAQQITEYITNQDECGLFMSIDALTMVLSAFLNEVRPPSKKAVKDAVIAALTRRVK